MTALLTIEDYHLAIRTFDGSVRVLNGIDLSLREGDTLGLPRSESYGFGRGLAVNPRH